MKSLSQLGIFLLLLIAFSGCYTQLAVVDRQRDISYQDASYSQEEAEYIEADTLYEEDAPIIQNFYLGGNYGEPLWDDWSYYDHWGVYVGFQAYDPFWYDYPWYLRSWYPIVVASPYWYWYSPYYDPWYWGPVYYGSKHYGKRPFDRRSPYSRNSRQLVRGSGGINQERSLQNSDSRRIIRRSASSTISNKRGEDGTTSRKILRRSSARHLQKQSSRSIKSSRRYRPVRTRYKPATKHSGSSSRTYRKSSSSSGSSRSIHRSSRSSSGSRSSSSSSSSSSRSNSGSRRSGRR